MVQARFFGKFKEFSMEIAPLCVYYVSILEKTMTYDTINNLMLYCLIVVDSKKIVFMMPCSYCFIIF